MTKITTTAAVISITLLMPLGSTFYLNRQTNPQAPRTPGPRRQARKPIPVL